MPKPAKPPGQNKPEKLTTVTATLHDASDTCAIDGVLAVTATLAPLEAGDSASMAGRIFNTGSLSIAETRDTALLQGTVSFILPATIQAAEARDSAALVVSSTSPLSSLANNTARSLGSYANPDPQFTGPNSGPLGLVSAVSITDYSGTAYDLAGGRILLFGGGHGPSEETDIRVFTLSTLTWSSLYSSTNVPAMLLSNLDIDKGRYISTLQPSARHTYNLTLVRGRRFYMMQPRGMPDVNDIPGPEPNGWGGRICYYDFDAAQWTFLSLGSAYVAPPNAPWYFAGQCCLDPTSQKILIISANSQAGTGNIWLYDPLTDSYQTGPAADPIASGDLIYFPPNDKFYLFGADPSLVYEVTLNRSTLAASTIVQLTVTGTPPAYDPVLPGVGFAYDTVNQLIGGNCRSGIFYVFDPLTRVWSSIGMLIEAGSSGTPSQYFHNCEFDPVSGCYIFLDLANASIPRTWAYRYQGQSNLAAAFTVSLDFGGGNIANFSGSSAVDKGDFVGEFVRQKCYLATDPAFPDWRVWIRPDANGLRDEVIVEYGRSTNGTPVHITSSYAATIKKNNVTVYTATVPQHWWYARWRYQSSQRPVVRTPATLKARGWIPNFGTAGLYGKTTADDYSVPWTGPMCAPARPSPWFPFDPYMGAGGDHEEIGYLTESGASYAIFSGSAALTTLRTQGEWTGNFCMHIRDDATGNMPAVRDLSSFFKSDGGTINNAPPGDPAVNPNFVALDDAHWYPCANMAWMLTDDPFCLEAFQFGLNLRILADRTVRLITGLPGLMDPLQTRAFAWGLRDLFQLHASMPSIVPGWLQPKSYWKSVIDDNKTFALQFVNSPARIAVLFRTWTRSDFDSSWMSAWLSAVIGMAIDQGFSDWGPIFAWSIGKQIAMTNGTSGWNRQWPVPYRSCAINNASYWSSFTWQPYTTTAVDAGTCTDWASYWSFYKGGGLSPNPLADDTGHPVDDSGWDGHTLMAQFYNTNNGQYTYAGYPVYFLHLRSALSIAVRRQIPSAQTCYDYMQTEMVSAFAHYGGGGPSLGECRFSIDPS